MLEKANEEAESGISYPFRAWMLLALMRLPPKKWAEYLKDMGHRFPRTRDEYRAMQNAIIREKVLETQVSTLHHEKGSHHNPGMYLAEESAANIDAPLPLYLCLGSPSET